MHSLELFQLHLCYVHIVTKLAKNNITVDKILKPSIQMSK